MHTKYDSCYDEIGLYAQKINLFSRVNCEHNSESPYVYYQGFREPSLDLQLLHLYSDSKNLK